MQTNAQELDRILRQKMEELPNQTASPLGWDRLEDALDGDADLELRNTLNSLAISQPVSGWEALERKLDPEATADAALATALNGIMPTAPAGSWNALKDKLDDSLGAEVDAIVSDNLNRETTRTSGWAALAARLELISHRRQLVGAWKVTEVCLLASLLLLLLRFGSGGNENDVIAALNGGFPINTAGTLGGQPTGENSLASTSSDNGVANAPVRTEVPSDQLHIENIDKSETDRSSPATAYSEGVLLRDLPLVTAALPVPVFKAELLSAESREQLTLDAVPSPRYTAQWGGTLPSPTLKLPEIDNSIPVRYYLNIFASPAEINEVITPQSSVSAVDITGRSEFSHSVSAGFLLDVSKGRDGLQVGAIYGRHAYTPSELFREDCIVAGNCPEGYTRFVYHSIAFPFSYERSLINRNDWRIATRVGMSLSVITKSEFNVPDSEDYSGLEEAIAAPDNVFGMPRRRPASNTIQAQQFLDPEAGWFEGGSLLPNASFYLGGGFTVERQINPRVSLYLSPSYGRVIILRGNGGVGPHDDRIHQAGLRFGSRYLLSRK